MFTLGNYLTTTFQKSVETIALFQSMSLFKLQELISIYSFFGNQKKSALIVFAEKQRSKSLKIGDITQLVKHIPGGLKLYAINNGFGAGS